MDPRIEEALRRIAEGWRVRLVVHSRDDWRSIMVRSGIDPEGQDQFFEGIEVLPSRIVVVPGQVLVLVTKDPGPFAAWSKLS